MKARFRLASLLLAACSQGDRPVVTPPPAAPAEAGPSMTTAPTAISDAGASIRPASTSTWRAVPAPAAGSPLFAVVDGLCSELTVRPAGEKAFVTYGGTRPSMAYDKAPQKREGRGTLAIFGDVLSAEGAPRADNIMDARAGKDGVAWAVEDTSGRSSISRRLHRYSATKGWSTTQAASGFGAIIGIVRPWTNGSILQVRDDWDSSEKFRSKFEREDETGPAPPDGLLSRATNDEWRMALETDTASSSIFVARPEDGKVSLRQWSPTMPLTAQVLPITNGSDPILEVRGSLEAYFALGSTLARWDGKTWTVVTTSGSSIVELAPRAEGGAYVLREDGKLDAIDATGKLATVPIPDPFETLASEGAQTWATSKNGALFRKDGDRFVAVPLPPPPYGVSTAVKARDVRIGTDGTTYVIAKYWEKGLAWSESELHWELLSTRRPSETMRCNEPDPENNNLGIGSGLQSWPPRATEACATPFVVLARRSNASGAPATWKAITSKLALPSKDGGAEGAPRFVEFKSGDRTFLGAVVPTVDAGTALAKRATAGSRLRPEVVCGVPDTIKALGPTD